MIRMQMRGRVIAALSRHIIAASLTLTLLVAPALGRNSHPPDVPVPSLTCENHEPIVWVRAASTISPVRRGTDEPTRVNIFASVTPTLMATVRPRTVSKDGSNTMRGWLAAKGGAVA